MSGHAYKFSVDPVDVPKIKTDNREIKTGIPCPGSREIIEKLAKYESRSMQGQIPLVWDRAEDCHIYDACGNKFIDFTSTIFVTNTGHANAHVIESVIDTLKKPLLHTYAYVTGIRADYHEKLVGFAGNNFEKAFLLSAGTEATEAAVKLMRLNGMKHGKRRPGIICIGGNWHGRTMGAQMLSSNEGQKEWIGFQDPNTFYIDFPYPWTLQGKSGKEFFAEALNKMLATEDIDIAQDCCGFMLETFQGWGAVFYPEDFVQEIRKVCDEHGLLLCFDEMQAGFGRTGKKFGYENYGVKADLLCLGKGMGSGFSVSGVIGSAEIMDLPDVGDMSSTHSANPIVCAAAMATLEEIENKGLVEKSATLGALFHSLLNELKNEFPEKISHVLGKGLLAALHFNYNEKPLSEFASKVCEKCLQKGLLMVHTGRESIKLAPPLTISENALREGVGVIKEAMLEVIEEEK